MPLPWIKMWLEALDDPKLSRLSLAERGAWWGVVMLAGKCNAGGRIVSGGAAMDVDEIADALHVKTEGDRQALESMIEKMGKRGSLRWNEGHTLTVSHWEERQRIPPSSKPEAVAERVRQHRERRKKTEEMAVRPHPSPEAQEMAMRPHATNQDNEVLRVWSGVKGFPEDGDEATRFLAKLRAEFPDVDILDESKRWAAAKLSQPLGEKSMPFKQLWGWMARAREYALTRKKNRGRAKGEVDPDKYIKGRYGHVVKR